MSDLYQAILLEELKKPQNKGDLVDANVTFNASNASCGDDMTVYLKIHDATLTDLKWQGKGCAISQATMSLLSAEIIGKRQDEISAIQQRDLEQLIGIEEISLGRVKCLMLGLRAVQQALRKLS